MLGVTSTNSTCGEATRPKGRLCGPPGGRLRTVKRKALGPDFELGVTGFCPGSILGMQDVGCLGMSGE